MSSTATIDVERMSVASDTLPNMLVGCLCSTLLPGHVVALLQADSFVAGAVRVAEDSEAR
jgi:hypothetical protein